MAVSMTFNSAGNVRASAGLAAGATDSGYLDYSTKIEGQVTVKNTPGATASVTRGVLVSFYPRYGSTPADTSITTHGDIMPSYAISTVESATFWLGTGKWKWEIRNLDASNAVTVEMTDATVDGV